MSECALSFIGDMTDCAVEPEQAGAPELDLVAVAGGEAALPVAADLALTKESLGVDSDVELGAVASPVVCEGLGRAACVGCPLFQQCLERQRLMESQEEPKSYLEELLDENGPVIVMARPAAKEQPKSSSPLPLPTQKQPDVSLGAVPTEELPRLLTLIKEPVASPEATTPMVEPKLVVEHDSASPAIDTPSLQPPPVLTEARSAPIEERASASSEECSTPQPTTPKVDTAATPLEESDRAELPTTSQPMNAGSVVISSSLESTIREAAVEVNIPPPDQSPASPVIAPAEPTLRDEPQDTESTVSERVFGDEPQSVPLVETEAETTPSIATLPDLLRQLPVGDEAVEPLTKQVGEAAMEMKYTLPDVPLAIHPEELVITVDNEECEELPCQTEQNGRGVKRSGAVMSGSETRQSSAASDESSGLFEQPGVDAVVDEVVDSSIHPQEQRMDTVCKQSSVVSKISVVEEGGIERLDDVSEACQSKFSATAPLSLDGAVKTTVRELADDTAVPFEDNASFCGDPIADNGPETEAPTPSDDTPWWSMILGAVAVFAALQRRQSTVY